MTEVMAAQPTLRHRKKQDTRARIIEVAIRMFGERGMEAPTVEEVAAAANVGKGTIYNYFRNKEEIVVAFMVEVERKLQAEARKFARLQGPLEGILTRYIRYHLEIKEPYRNFIPVVLGQLFVRGSDLLPHLEKLHGAMDPPLLEWFSTLRERRLLREDVDLPMLAQIFKLLHFGIVVIWLNDSPPYRETMRWLKEEMRLFCQGLAPNGRRATGLKARHFAIQPKRKKPK
jgi:AcrR family transcriptional regulator